MAGIPKKYFRILAIGLSYTHNRSRISMRQGARTGTIPSAGPRCSGLYTTGKEIYKWEDCQGLKARGADPAPESRQQAVGIVPICRHRHVTAGFCSGGIIHIFRTGLHNGCHATAVNRRAHLTPDSSFAGVKSALVCRTGHPSHKYRGADATGGANSVCIQGNG
jgi:hypothetical protein